nr:MAG TPA: hypothetical protein [Caudoviricetes sp.]
MTKLLNSLELNLAKAIYSIAKARCNLNNSDKGWLKVKSYIEILIENNID